MTVDPIRRVGIICAITREIELLKDAVIDAAVQKVAGRDFISGTLSGVPVVLCLSGVGKVAAAVTTSIMADRFRIASILFIGVAGALGDGIKVGDIVIATHLLQHDVDVRPFYEQYVLPMPHSIARLPVVDSLVEAAARACAQYIGAEMHDDISEDLFAHFGMSSQGPTGPPPASSCPATSSSPPLRSVTGSSAASPTPCAVRWRAPPSRRPPRSLPCPAASSGSCPTLPTAQRTSTSMPSATRCPLSSSSASRRSCWPPRRPSWPTTPITASAEVTASPL
eukprot:gnl/Ergobibamus_cyprinoides/2758.p1 GENE.gnl/Ergobibamus_cyprinoides/2758~~gnl/Ergobibamus_cyprinoides/2758.p1  ORF type:complete len:288 (-),score=67.43 gnl/Ergobibamus_cyprinoides/2758:61-903(-)